VSTDTKDDKPFRVGGSLSISLGVSQGWNVNCSLTVDFLLRSRNVLISYINSHRNTLLTVQTQLKCKKYLLISKSFEGLSIPKVRIFYKWNTFLFMFLIPFFAFEKNNLWMYLCLKKRGFPLHLIVTHLPTGISFKFTSILAKARTSLDADILRKKRNYWLESNAKSTVLFGFFRLHLTLGSATIKSNWITKHVKYVAECACQKVRFKDFSISLRSVNDVQNINRHGKNY